MASVFDHLYTHLPISLQHVAVSLYGAYWYWLRFGSGYQKYINEYKVHEHLDTADWHDYQTQRLQALLPVVADAVPYYRKTWTTIHKEAAKSGQLHSLPILDKSAVRAEPEKFLRQDMDTRNYHIFHTSGSTGIPIATIWTTQELRRSMALREARSAQWAGVSFHVPRATFSGRLVEPNPESKGPFYRFNLAERQVYFSAFHLGPETVHCYVNALRKHRIQWITGYAVSCYLLAKFALDQRIPIPPLKAIVTTSEKVTPEMRGVMETAFQCKVFEEYSTVENVIFAHECEHGRLHVSPDVAVVEILRADGTPCEPGEIGEVVTTGLLRTYQPFIRYRLGDLAMWDNQTCPCGREMPIIKEVVGRVEDVIVGSDGRQMVRFHGIFANQPNIIEGQVIQETREHIRVKVVPTENFSAADISDVEQRMRQRLGAGIEIVVEPVNSIPRTRAGKFQAVISLLDREELRLLRESEGHGSRQI